MIKQISIFAANCKGSMKKITETVSDAGIDIYNVVTNDSAEFGIVRMLVTASSNINIDYLYVSYSRDSKTPLAVMKAPSYAEVEESLQSKGYTTV